MRERRPGDGGAYCAADKKEARIEPIHPATRFGREQIDCAPAERLISNHAPSIKNAATASMAIDATRDTPEASANAASSAATMATA
jgi:hypothetical protein